MKTVKLRRSNETVEVPVLFSIFDMGNSLLEENFETPAKNAQHALKIYNEKYGKTTKYKRDGSKYAEVCVSTFFTEDGTRYKAGNRVWFKKI
jgi:hypothetical protein